MRTVIGDLVAIAGVALVVAAGWRLHAALGLGLLGAACLVVAVYVARKRE